nr:YncE family protein [Kozakia baliensis]
MKFSRSVLTAALMGAVATFGSARAQTTEQAPQPPMVMSPAAAAPAQAADAVQTIPGMPPVIDPHNIYSETTAGKISPAIASDPPRIYVPNLRGNSVSVIDPASFMVVDTFKVGRSPQHVVPSWDLRTLWVTNNSEGRTDGSLTPIDPHTAKPGPEVAVDDPYNMYFTPDGKYAITVAEAHERLDFRDPHSMALLGSVEAPQCKGINHADFSIDGRYAIFTCEFGGYLAKVDTVNRQLIGYLKLSKGGMPQDILTAPDGHKFYIADMWADGVFVVDGDSFKETGFIPTGVGTHGEYPSRDGKWLYVANRGSHKVHGRRHGPGSVSVIDFATDRVVKTWTVPGGGSPDMGNVSADGKLLWLSGRFDDVVYAIDTDTGAMRQIPVGAEPHGLTVWPQPGRYSVGHTGILR